MSYVDNALRDLRSSDLPAFVSDGRAFRAAAAPGNGTTLPAGLTGISAGSEILLAQVGEDGKLRSDGRALQPLVVNAPLRDNLDAFLGIDLGAGADGPTQAFYSFQQMPDNLRRPGLLGAAGTTGGERQLSVALVDLPQIASVATGLGVDPQGAAAAIIGQELVHAAVIGHPDFSGRMTATQNETLGEAYSLRNGGRDYLPFHLSVVASSERSAQSSESAGYDAFMPLSNPVIGAALREQGVGEGSDDQRARTFLANFAAFRDARLAARAPGDPAPNDIVVDFAKSQGIEDPETFADTLVRDLSEAYGDAATDILEQERESEPAAVAMASLSSPWDYRPSV